MIPNRWIVSLILKQKQIIAREMGKHNHVTTTYHLFVEKKKRSGGFLKTMDQRTHAGFEAPDRVNGTVIHRRFGGSTVSVLYELYVSSDPQKATPCVWCVLVNVFLDTQHRDLRQVDDGNSWSHWSSETHLRPTSKSISKAFLLLKSNFSGL